MSNTLPISRLVNVNVTLTAKAAQGQNISTLLILGSSPVIDTVTRIRSYSSIEEVAAQFGTSAPEYSAALLYFQQAPQPTDLKIGRWVKIASAGQLLGAPLSTAQQAIANWNTIANGGFTVTIDGGAAQHLAGLDFTLSANMNGVAGVIDAALNASADVTWDPIFNRFVITSHTTGVASLVSFLTAPTGGGVVDISAQLGMTNGSSGIISAPGLVPETALQCVTLFDSDFGMQWYAVTILGSVDADSIGVAGFIEGTTTKHFFGVTTQEAAVLTPGDTTNISYVLSQLKYNKTAVQYSSSSPYAVVSLLARILTTDYTQNNSTITLMYKQEPGITAETLNLTQINALESCNCNVFTAYNNNTAIIEQGVSVSGNFIDTIIGSDALAIDIQTAVFNTLYGSPTKIPQTDAGTHILTTAIAQVCSQYVANGLLATGEWNSTGFGSLNTGDTVPNGGFYIFAPSVNSQTPAQRAKRVSVPIQIAAKLAGAVQTVDVSITVNT